jgi:hypothetical protein
MKTRIFVCLSLMFAAGVHAQDGTPLSSTGVGEFTSFGSSWSAGMGNSGIALVRNGYLSGLNPATWGGLGNVQFTALYNFDGVNSKDNTIGQSSYYANGDFGGGIFALPIDKSLGISLAAGFSPLTSYNFTTMSSVDSTSNISSYVYKASGSGGLGEGFVGMSISPSYFMRLGGMFQYAFGRIENTRTVTFSNSSYTTTYSDYSAYMHSPGGTFGVVLDSLDKVFDADFLKGVSVGGYYKLSYNLSGTFVLENLYGDSLYSPFSENGTGSIPAEYGIGFSKSFSDRVSALLDIRFQPLSKYHDTHTPSGSLRDVLFLGGGVEIRSGRDFGSIYDKRIIRAGIYYQKSQFAVPTNSGQTKQLDELFLTAGIELPISYSATASLAAQYGLRGLSSDFLLREQIFRIYFSITLGEGWFMRPEGD